MTVAEHNALGALERGLRALYGCPPDVEFKKRLLQGEYDPYCGEYGYCEDWHELYVYASLELGLRWLHDRGRRKDSAMLARRLELTERKLEIAVNGLKRIMAMCDTVLHERDIR